MRFTIHSTEYDKPNVAGLSLKHVRGHLWEVEIDSLLNLLGLIGQVDGHRVIIMFRTREEWAEAYDIQTPAAWDIEIYNGYRE